MYIFIAIVDSTRHWLLKHYYPCHSRSSFSLYMRLFFYAVPKKKYIGCLTTMYINGLEGLSIGSIFCITDHRNEEINDNHSSKN